MKIIDVSLVLNPDVPAIRTVNMGGLGRRCLLCHGTSSSWVLKIALAHDRQAF